MPKKSAYRPARRIKDRQLQQPKVKLKAVRAKKERINKKEQLKLQQYEERRKAREMESLRSLGPAGSMPIRINSYTVVYIKAGQDPAKILEKYSYLNKG